MKDIKPIVLLDEYEKNNKTNYEDISFEFDLPKEASPLFMTACCCRSNEQGYYPFTRDRQIIKVKKKWA